MKIGIDIDGVLANFGQAFAAVLHKRWNTRFDIDPQPTKWDWSDLGLTKEEENWAWEEVKRTPNFWVGLEPYHDNVRALASHRTMFPEDEIFYVTSRVPSAGLPVMHQSQRWLLAHGIYGLGTSVIVKPKNIEKDIIYDAIGVTTAIDDYLPACVDMIQCLDRPWNQGDTYAHRYKDLRSFLAQRR